MPRDSTQSILDLGQIQSIVGERFRRRIRVSFRDETIQCVVFKLHDVPIRGRRGLNTANRIVGERRGCAAHGAGYTGEILRRRVIAERRRFVLGVRDGERLPERVVGKVRILQRAVGRGRGRWIEL